MPDREKVIALLERYVRIPNLAGAENYGAKIVDMPAQLITDALALLKAQEPVMVEERADTNTINCPKCGQRFAKVGLDKSIYLDIDETPNYCWICGKAVKWDG